MISFIQLDYFVISLFFLVIIAITFYFYKKKVNKVDEYFLSNRKVGLFLFVATNVATWYGGILGVGEFTYKFGISSWFIQGVPYYFFAFLFAIFFARKIRKTNFYTIPELINKRYGRKIAIIVSGLILILTSPAPYILMVGYLLSIIFNISHTYGIVLSSLLTVVYLYFGGYRSNVITDLFLFCIMYLGFVLMFAYSYGNLGGIEYLQSALPETHLSLTGGANWTYLLTWFLIALWTFADPGFHQRCYSAEKPKIAFWGILISIPLWFIFDFFTNSVGLYARASVPNLTEGFLAFPLLADKLLPGGIKGIFFIALFATILSTVNSFLFISAQTYGRDILKLLKPEKEIDSVKHTRFGLVICATLSVILAISFTSIIEMWYMIGSICIPGVILLVIGAYYDKFLVSEKIAIAETIAGSGGALILYLIKTNLNIELLMNIEPMIFGLVVALIIHIFGIIYQKHKQISLPL
jgi:SSS family solute:Na+ symporter